MYLIVFLIGGPMFDYQDLQQFKSFGITNLNPTSMHHHFMNCRGFRWMTFLDDVDTRDATQEFRNICEEIKKNKNFLPSNLKKYGETEYLILDWDHFGLLLKHVDPKIQAVVKKIAISTFGKFDPGHEEEWCEQDIDHNSFQTFKMLKESGLMDKDAYIALYQKALNRNYSLKDFDNAIGRFIPKEERKKAREEILRNAFYPYPRTGWQKSSTKGKPYKISRIPIPKNVAKKGNVRDLLKQKIFEQGKARKTKIRTDMIGKDSTGKPIIVDNLEDWLFGVLRAPGNLYLEGVSTVTLPPQTPEFAVRLIEDTLKDIEYPGHSEQL